VLTETIPEKDETDREPEEKKIIAASIPNWKKFVELTNPELAKKLAKAK